MYGFDEKCYPSSIVTPFIKTLFEMRLFILTVVFDPSVQFFNDVFSVMVVKSPTAQFIICVELTLLCGDINAGLFIGNNLSHKSKICNFEKKKKIISEKKYICKKKKKQVKNAIHK